MKRQKQEEFNFNIHQQLLDEARYILLYDEIDKDSAKEINTKLLGMALQNCKKEILLEINSPGGDVACGMAIINTMIHSPCPIITIVNGYAASMAGFISVVGDHRLITKGSYWMAHAGEDGVIGNPQTILDRGVFLKRLEKDLNKIFTDKTKINKEEFEAILKGELWFSPEECLKKGIVDEIIDNFSRKIELKEKKRKK